MNGLFDKFENLDQIKIEDVARWLKPTPRLTALENYIGNRILYPQAIPIFLTDMKKDLAILREALRLNTPSEHSQEKAEFFNNTPFLNITMRRIIIPEDFLEFVPDLTSLVWAFVDGLLYNLSKKDWFQDLWTIVLGSEVDKVVGSVLLPQFGNLNGFMDIKLEGKNYKIQAGSFAVLPCPKYRCSIEYKLNHGTLLGKSISAVEVYGGDAGLAIDGRIL